MENKDLDKKAKIKAFKWRFFHTGLMFNWISILPWSDANTKPRGE